MPTKSASQKRNEELEKEVSLLEGHLAIARLDHGMARAECDQAKANLADADQEAQRMAGIIQRRSNAQRKLLRMVYAGDLKAAHLEGYIAHVREAANNGAQDPGERPSTDFDYERDRLLNASERQFGKIIDNMDSEVLDVVLGRDDDDEIPF